MTIDLESMSIASGAFSSRVVTALRRAQIGSLGQIDQMSDDELTSIHGIGLETVRSLRRTIAEFRARRGIRATVRTSNAAAGPRHEPGYEHLHAGSGCHGHLQDRESQHQCHRDTAIRGDASRADDPRPCLHQGDAALREAASQCATVTNSISPICTPANCVPSRSGIA